MIKSLDYVYVTRPMLFFPGWSTLLAGYLVTTRQTAVWQHIFQGDWQPRWWDPSVVLCLLAFMLAMGGSFILNQLQDVDSDRENKKLFLIGEEHIPVRAAWTESLLLIATSLIAGFLLNKTILMLLVLFVLITGYLYNYPPFQYKNTTIPGFILNILMGWIAFALGWALLRPLNWEFIRLSLPYLFLNSGLYLLTTLPDIQGDRAVGKKTFAVRFGFQVTVLTAELLFLASLIVAFLNRDQLILGIDLLSLPWFFALFVRRNLPAAIKAIKMAIFFFSLVICVKFPPYFLLMVSVFYLTRIYYRKRFHFDYPNFRGE